MVNSESISAANMFEIHPNLPNQKFSQINSLHYESNSNNGLDTVLAYEFKNPRGLWSSNVTITAQDRVVQWFVAPTDMIIKRAGFGTRFTEKAGLEVELKLVSLLWPIDFLNDLYETTPIHWGYYNAPGNGLYNKTALPGDPDNELQEWIDIEGSGMGSPFGEDIWSDNGYGDTIIADREATIRNYYQWIDMSQFGNITVKKDEIIGVVLKNTSKNITKDRISLYANYSPRYAGFKYAVKGFGNGDTSTIGWWSMSFTFDFALDVTLTGDLSPDIEYMKVLQLTVSEENRNVTAIFTDRNPTGGPTGVVMAKLHYSINDEEFIETAMTNIEGNEYSGLIPGQLPGTKITYYVSAEDVNGNTINNKRDSVTYKIFKATHGQTNLVIWNSAYPNYSNRYFDKDIYDFDYLPNGFVTTEFLSNYSNVFEICTGGPIEINNEAVREWLASSSTNNYALFGDEWLGYQSDNSDRTYSEGDFQFDIFGISSHYNNIHNNIYRDWSIVNPVVGSLIGGDLYVLHNEVSIDSGWTSPMVVDPSWLWDINKGYLDNKLDGIEFLEDVEVFMTGIGSDSKEYNIAGSRILPNGNKIAFMAADSKSLSSDTENHIEYFWYGGSPASPTNKVAEWFGVNTSITYDAETIPESFKLYQNYPNPFNPVTTIQYSIPSKVKGERSKVSLKVYDLLAREVTVLVNEEQHTGSYKVTFDATNLSSGIYLYQIIASDFIDSKKMVLLR